MNTRLIKFTICQRVRVDVRVRPEGGCHTTGEALVVAQADVDVLVASERPGAED